MKRKAHTYGRKGKGGYYQAPVTTRRPAGSVQPIISNRKHGKMKYINSIQEGAAGFSRLIRWSIAGAIIAAVLSVSMCAATVAHGQTSPDLQFRSLFQIRYALPDTVQLLHVGYNIRVNAAGVEAVPLNPAVGPLPAIAVQSWITGDAGEWIGITRSGATVTLWGSGADMYLEIATDREVMDFYNMAPPVLTWKERNKL